MNKVWLDIKGFEHIYKISNDGCVMSCKKGIILKQQIDKDGYGYVRLWSHCVPKHCHIHRLVAQAFIPNPKNKPQVNHKNGTKTDNRAENLEWNTSSENISHAFAVLNRRPSRQSPVKCIETNIVYKSATEASKHTGISASCISMAARKVKRKVHNHDCTHKTAGGYHWEYLPTLE